MIMKLKITVAVLTLWCSILAFADDMALTQPDKSILHSSDSYNSQFVKHKGDPPTYKYHDKIVAQLKAARVGAGILERLLPDTDIEELAVLLGGQTKEGAQLFPEAYYLFFINRVQSVAQGPIIDSLKIDLVKDPTDLSRYTITILWEFIDQNEDYDISSPTTFTYVKEYYSTGVKTNWQIKTEPPIQ